MGKFSASITRRVRKRVLTSGKQVRQVRFVLQFRDPAAHKRKQLFFSSREEALTKRDELALAFANGARLTERASALTVADAVAHWLESRDGAVKKSTLKDYKQVSSKHLAALGHRRVADMTTAEIRAWHKTVMEGTGVYTANKAKKLLSMALSLLAEDTGCRVPRMPTRLSRAVRKAVKAILSPADVGRVLAAAQRDVRLIYVAFPFLSGVRPNEMLGLLWKEVDLNTNHMRICRVLERDGSLTEETKTAAGQRSVPIGPTLRQLLLDWKEQCPSAEFVFPNPEGRAFTYQNFRKRAWKPGRHGFHCKLQARSRFATGQNQDSGQRSLSTCHAVYCVITCERARCPKPRSCRVTTQEALFQAGKKMAARATMA